MLGNNRFFVSKELSTSQIDWEAVSELLERNAADTDRRGIARDAAQFKKKLTSFLRLEWFARGALSEPDNQVAGALAQLNGADSLIVSHNNRLLSFPLLLEYRHLIALSPRFAKIQGAQSSATGSVRVDAELRVGRVALRINSLLRVLMLHMFGFLAGVLIYTIAAYFFLYSMSVFILFLQEPQVLTLAALRQGKLGIALLAFLIFLAVILGKLSRMAANLIFRGKKRK